MTYATKQHMIDRCGEPELVQVTNRETPSTGAIVDAVLNEALADAEAEANGYLAARMTTPVDPVPATLTRHVVAIARYLLWKNKASERVRSDYEDARTWLKDVAAGRVALGNSGDTATTPPSSGAPRVHAKPRKFSGDF
jgi:phage gp36-like protein